MTTHEAIAKCAAQGLLSFPKESTNAETIIRRQYNREGARKDFSERRSPESGTVSLQDEAVCGGADSPAPPRTRYKKPLRGPNYKPQRYVIRP